MSYSCILDTIWQSLGESSDWRGRQADYVQCHYKEEWNGSQWLSQWWMWRYVWTTITSPALHAPWDRYMRYALLFMKNADMELSQIARDSYPLVKWGNRRSGCDGLLSRCQPWHRGNKWHWTLISISVNISAITAGVKLALPSCSEFPLTCVFWTDVLYLPHWQGNG